MKAAARKPIATWWKIERYSASIAPVEVVAFTAKFVTFLEKQWSLSGEIWRETRESRDDIFPTFAEAKTVLVDRAAERVEHAKIALERNLSILNAVEKLTEAEPNAAPQLKPETR